MKPATHSLERRLIFRLTTILAASFLLFAVVYTLLIQNDAHFDAAEEVGELARDMAHTIHPLPGGRSGFDPAAVASLSDWPTGSAYAAVDLVTGIVVDGSSASLLAAVQNRPGAQFSSAELVDRDGGLDVLAVERVDLNGARYRVAVLRPMSNGGIALTGLGYEFADEILPTFLPSLLLAVLVTWVTIRVNLRPLRRASREAELISVNNPGQRMSTEGMASELVPMIAAVNRALDRLESGIAAQERFTANAAHELRTPLAVLRARVDGMAPGAERTALTRDIDRMTRAVSQMLLTARLQSHQLDSTEPVELVPLVRDVVADLAPLAHANGRDLVLDALDHPRVTASAGALESAVRNLIENALRFSPVGEAVTVRVGPGPQVIVEDCGPGVPKADRTHIFEPFWRVSEPPGDGAGLGLAIVRAVAGLHQGSVTVEDRPGGGARFVFMLPDMPSVEPATGRPQQ